MAGQSGLVDIMQCVLLTYSLLSAVAYLSGHKSCCFFNINIIIKFSSPKPDQLTVVYTLLQATPKKTTAAKKKTPTKKAAPKAKTSTATKKKTPAKKAAGAKKAPVKKAATKKAAPKAKAAKAAPAATAAA